MSVPNGQFVHDNVYAKVYKTSRYHVVEPAAPFFVPPAVEDDPMEVSSDSEEVVVVQANPVASSKRKVTIFIDSSSDEDSYERVSRSATKAHRMRCYHTVIDLTGETD